jgi:hypothetical protein
VDSAFEPERWQDFYLMVGGAAAVLTGLIFVAMSLHVRSIVADPWHRGRAGSSLISLMSAVVIAGAVLIPDQPLELLAVEVIAVALVSPLYAARGFVHLPDGHRVAFVLELTIGVVGAALAVLAGLSLMVEQGPGLWLLVPVSAIVLGSSVWNAWRLVVDVASRDDAA